MTLSTCIRTFAVCLGNSTSSGFNYFLPLVKEEMTNCAPYVPNFPCFRNIEPSICHNFVIMIYLSEKKLSFLWYAGRLISRPILLK